MVRILLPCLVALGCTGEPAKTGTGDTAEPGTTDTTPTAETGQTGPTDTGPTDTTPPDPECLQETAAFSGQVEFVEEDVTVDADTLAIVTTAPAPTAPLPKGFDLQDVPYYGAVDPSGGTPWWAGWTMLDQISIDGSLPGGANPLSADVIGGTISGAALHDCANIGPTFTDLGFVRVFNEQFPACLVQGRITTDVTLRNDHVYFLVGTVTVGTGDAALGGGPADTGVTLTVDPGTQVYAASLPNIFTSLVISRGSKIDARGTPELPILFAALQGNDKGISDPNAIDVTVRGAWGGLILSGFGQVEGGDGNGEASALYRPQGVNRRYGGLDNADDSGALEYVIIAEAGKEFRQGLLVSGLVLEGVGSATTIDHVQVVSSNGDCMGAFGGAPNVRHLVCNGAGDDNIDVDSGFAGSVQFALIRLGASNGDNGIEADNDPYAGTGVYANLTVLGNAGDDGSSRGALHRTGAGGRVFRSVFADDTPAGGTFGAGCLDVDDELTTTLEYRDVIFDCSPGPLTPCEAGEDP